MGHYERIQDPKIVRLKGLLSTSISCAHNNSITANDCMQRLLVAHDAHIGAGHTIGANMRASITNAIVAGDALILTLEQALEQLHGVDTAKLVYVRD